MQVRRAQWVALSIFSVLAVGDAGAWGGSSDQPVVRGAPASGRAAKRCRRASWPNVTSHEVETFDMPVSPSTPPPCAGSRSLIEGEMGQLACEPPEGIAQQLRESSWRSDGAAVVNALFELRGCERIFDEAVTPLECVFRRASPTFADHVICALRNERKGCGSSDLRNVSITRLRGADYDPQAAAEDRKIDWDAPIDWEAIEDEERWLDPEEKLLRALARECCELFPVHASDEWRDKIAQNHRAVITKLLAAGAQLDPMRDAVLLKTAAYLADEQAVELLLQAGVPADAGGAPLGDSPLYLAASQGHEKIVQRLLADGASISEPRGGRGKTILHLLAEHAKPHTARMMELLLKEGLDENLSSFVNARDHNGNTPMHVAASSGSLDVVRLLCKHGADLHTCNWVDDTPLHLAAYGNPDVVAFLLQEEDGADVHVRTHSRQCTPLHGAASGGSAECARLLLQAGADPDARDSDEQVPLHYAAQQGAGEAIRTLCKYGADVDAHEESGDTPLCRAVFCDQCEVVRVLLEECGADSNTPGPDGLTPLHVAARAGSELIVRMLLAHGANPKATHAQGRTPLHEAACRGKIAVARMLIEAGADVSAADCYRVTPLVAAAQEGYVDMVKFLIEQGADTEDEERRDVMLSQITRHGKLKDRVLRVLLERGMGMACAFACEGVCHSRSMRVRKKSDRVRASNAKGARSRNTRKRVCHDDKGRLFKVGMRYE